MQKENDILIDSDISAYRKNMYTWYTIKHDNCKIDEIRDDWDYCPGCGKKIIWETDEGYMDGY